MDKFLLQLVGEVVLLTEEDDTALADCNVELSLNCILKLRGMSPTRDSEVSQECISLRRGQQVVHNVDLWKLSADNRGHIFRLKLVQRSSLFQCFATVILCRGVSAEIAFTNGTHFDSTSISQ